MGEIPGRVRAHAGDGGVSGTPGENAPEVAGSSACGAPNGTTGSTASRGKAACQQVREETNSSARQVFFIEKPFWSWGELSSERRKCVAEPSRGHRGGDLLVGHGVAVLVELDRALQDVGHGGSDESSGRGRSEHTGPVPEGLHQGMSARGDEGGQHFGAKLKLMVAFAVDAEEIAGAHDAATLVEGTFEQAVETCFEGALRFRPQSESGGVGCSPSSGPPPVVLPAVVEEFVVGQRSNAH